MRVVVRQGFYCTGCIGNGIVSWVEQLLTAMRQKVIVDGDVSSWKSVLCRVPQ